MAIKHLLFPPDNKRPQASVTLLPFTHATSWSNFRGILKDGFLRPARCPVFGEELLYFFCGSVARRASDQAMPWGRSESPVILVFKPELIQRIFRFFPMDTGALAANRLKVCTKNFREALRIPVTGDITPWRFISSVYGDAENYRAGRPMPEIVNHPTSLDRFMEILNGHLTSPYADHRRFSVECQTRVIVPVNSFVSSILVPAERVPEMKKLDARRDLNWRAYAPSGLPLFIPSSRHSACAIPFRPERRGRQHPSPESWFRMDLN